MNNDETNEFFWVKWNNWKEKWFISFGVWVQQLVQVNTTIHSNVFDDDHLLFWLLMLLQLLNLLMFIPIGLLKWLAQILAYLILLLLDYVIPCGILQYSSNLKSTRNWFSLRFFSKSVASIRSTYLQNLGWKIDTDVKWNFERRIWVFGLRHWIWLIRLIRIVSTGKVAAFRWGRWCWWWCVQVRNAVAGSRNLKLLCAWMCHMRMVNIWHSSRLHW